MARLVLKLISFLVTFLLAIIIVKALMFAVNIIGELPVLGLINRFAGGRSAWCSHSLSSGSDSWS